MEMCSALAETFSNSTKRKWFERADPLDADFDPDQANVKLPRLVSEVGAGDDDASEGFGFSCDEDWFWRPPSYKTHGMAKNEEENNPCARFVRSWTAANLIRTRPQYARFAQVHN